MLVCRLFVAALAYFIPAKQEADWRWLVVTVSVISLGVGLRISHQATNASYSLAPTVPTDAELEVGRASATV